VDLSATPSGWVPVDLGDAQISVPANWESVYDDRLCDWEAAPGDVVVNPPSPPISCPASIRGQPSTIVILERLAHGAASSKSALTINGIVVRLVGVSQPKCIGCMSITTYLVPSLGVQIAVSGSLASRVLHTLTRSPRDIALAPGRAPAIPSSWHRVSFDGVSAAVPDGWMITRTDLYPESCSRLTGVVEFLGTTTVVLDTDQKSILLNCPYIPPVQSPEPPGNGLRIDELNIHPQPAKPSLGSCRQMGGLTACPLSSPAYSVLALRVGYSGSCTTSSCHVPTGDVSIGLAGNGIVARTILYSLRAS